MENISTVVTSILVAIVVSLFAFLLGRKKEEIKIALDYQTYYNKFLEELKKEILEYKAEILEQKKIIENQKEVIKEWEKNCSKFSDMIKSERAKFLKENGDEEN